MSEQVVVVTGANGLVGSHVVAALVARGARVRAVVRREGAAPAGDGVEEHVGEFGDAAFAAEVVAGATALVTTVYPLGSDDRAEQEKASVEGTTTIVRAATEAGVPVVVHLSTAGVYDRTPGIGDVDEDGALVGDDDVDYPVVKRDTDAALAAIDGTTRVLLRPPAILGPGDSSIWNTLRPQQLRDDVAPPHAVPDKTFAWVHVRDLATLAADLATGAIAPAADGAETGPAEGSCTPVNVAGEPATQRDYVGTVAAALGVQPVWDDEPAWTGQIAADRARGWGWTPQVSLGEALGELEAGVRELAAPDQA